MKQQFLIGTLTTLLSLLRITNLEAVLAQSAPQQDNTEAINITSADIIGSLNPLIQNVSGQFPGGQSLGNKPTINTLVTKTITNPWKMEVSPGSSENDFTIEYRLESLNHPTVSNSKIKVLQIESINKRTEMELPSETTVLTDDIQLTLDVSKIRASGEHLGTLEVTVTQTGI